MINVYEREGVTFVEASLVNTNRKGSTVYNYLVDGLLIDTGPHRLEAELISFYGKNPFDRVILTHSHEDHSGTAAWIQENIKVPIYVHPKGVSLCAQPCSYPEYRQKTWGVRKELTTLPIGDKIQSRNEEWTIIDTPGHAEDHISLFHEETGRLFSGDLFVNPKPKVMMESESIPVIMHSIRKLLSYEIDIMFCSHAGYIQDGKRG